MWRCHGRFGKNLQDTGPSFGDTRTLNWRPSARRDLPEAVSKWRAGPSANVPTSVSVEVHPPLRFFVPHFELVLHKIPMWDHCLCLGMGLYNILPQGERLFVIKAWLPASRQLYI